MAKLHLDRLKRQYKGVAISGSNYESIINQIIDNNTSNTQNKIYKFGEQKWKKFESKYRPDKETKLVLPSSEDVIPKRGIQIRKVAEKGDFIRDSLRESLTSKLRQSLQDTDTAYLKKRGTTAGRINPELIKKFEGDIRKIFNNYARKDPKLGVPSNVHAIAVTEIRGTINDTKNEFTKQMIQNNPNLSVKKRWIHNRQLSKVPRKGHVILNNKTIEFDSFFSVPHYEKRGGRFIKTDTHLMRYPHDPIAPAEQVINCNCDYDIIVTKFRKVNQ